MGMFLVTKSRTLLNIMLTLQGSCGHPFEPYHWVPNYHIEVGGGGRSHYLAHVILVSITKCSPMRGSPMR